VDILVLDRGGQLRGRFQGAAEIGAALELVDRLSGGNKSSGL
jgi:hypothetical protein